jgi:hypothetical protein
MFELFVKQVPSLKKLVTFWSSHNCITIYPETKEFSKNLSEYYFITYHKYVIIYHY